MSHAQLGSLPVDASLLAGSRQIERMHTANAATTRDAKHPEYVGIAEWINRQKIQG